MECRQKYFGGEADAPNSAHGSKSEITKLLRIDELPAGWCTYPDTLTGYRVNFSIKAATKSIFDRRHNEFWMIWSDILPLCAFVVLFVVNIASETFEKRIFFSKCLVGGVFVAVIISRVCSSIYHIYNCYSLKVNQTMINLDLIGICCMAFGSPWVFANANKIESFLDPRFLIYTSVLFSIFAVCVLFLIFIFIDGGESSKWLKFRQPFLIVLAGLGNFPAIQLGANDDFPSTWRVLVLLAVAGFIVGYSVFYICRVPEIFLKKGVSDGQIWNSHVIWHMVASTAQLCYILTTFLQPL